MDETFPSPAAHILDLLRRAYGERRSGQLHLDRGDEHRGLAVREGHVVYGLSDVAGERLGDVLVRHGDVSQADLDRAEATARSEGRLLGAVLVATGLVERSQLEEAVACHVRAILFSALDEPGASPTFEPTGGRPDDSGGWVPASPLSTGQLLLDAARRLEDPAVVREALGDLERKLVLANDPWLRAHPVALTPTDGFVLSRVDGTLSARELVGLIPLPAEETEKSLLGLLCTGAVAFAADRPAAPRAASSRPPAPAPSPPPTPPSPAQPVGLAPAGPPKEAPSRAPGPSPEEVRRLIVESYDPHRRRDHFEVLGVTPAADATEVRAAYARLARILHPDACRDPVLADVSEQRETVFARVREAYEALRDPTARSEYEVELRRRKLRATASIPASAVEPPASAPAASQPDAPLEQIIATGEELVRSGEYGEAIQQIEPVLERTEGALRIRARMALARASMKYPEWRRRAEAHLQEVLRGDPAQLQDAVRLEAYLLLGDIYRASELPVRAAAMYRKALAVQPGNKHALRELAGLEGAASPPPGSSSRLGFLKKR
jgi:curved DNA-binding protein CbpA